MDLELYRTFLAIADSGGFTSAAEIVGRTQSAVSQQVKRLEDAFGQPLVDRTATPVSLTEYGKSLLRPAREIVDMHDEAMAMFRRTTFEGVVVVGVADAYVNRILKDVLTEFRSLLPQGTISIVIDGSLDLSRRIANGSVDLAFVTEGNCPTRGPVAFTDRLVVVGPSAINLSKVDPLPVAVWDERNQDELPLVAALEAMGRHYRPVCMCRSVHAQHQAVTANLCVAVLVEGSMVEGERAYLEEDGFPVMKHLNIRLERSYAKRSPVIDRLGKHYLDFFARQSADAAGK
ncbi:LysR family transcriptional regulator [Defluviimonas sp. WL0024]|uniref:LysR family transcriptional regulator n=2 Tax=Albidovulum TaxID=205889 RepID=A0ABT3J6X9_9RHOB|nr:MULTISPECIES: LysR family transcriptional regulator [Defluviimonas]MCU9850105.1 LysR family transcriptional regulator [Defluviimonas sp. WL0024]MCW3783420.1 LysR family transcriptional regulator [Defluviimonas salinarum]